MRRRNPVSGRSRKSDLRIHFDLDSSDRMFNGYGSALWKV
jgi:hypothetical protein